MTSRLWSQRHFHQQSRPLQQHPVDRQAGGPTAVDQHRGLPRPGADRGAAGQPGDRLQGRGQRQALWSDTG